MPLCGNCFHELHTSGPCPLCGYDGTGKDKKHPQALRPGAILNGRYIVGRVLGQGGFGITYLALDNPSGERVAIKEYYPSELAGRGLDGCTVAIHSEERAENFAYGKAQFLEEARTLAAVSGSGSIVRIYSYFEENGTAYFAMEYVEGVPLDEYLRQKSGQLTAQEAETLFLPLMAALETVHKKGIVHRDIAPDNLIVTGDGTVKLIDFGAARYSTGEKSKSLDVILKHGFAPYEQYMRRGRQGPWTDVYALAATFYYAVTGKVPPEAVERMQEDSLQKPSALGVNLGKGTEAVLLKALSVQAQERWQSMGEFSGALQAAAMAEAEERKKAEQERLAREAREREAKERAERLEREKREKAERAAQKKAEREKARAARQAEKSAPAEKKKNPLPLILAAAAVLALVIFGATRLAKRPSPALTASPAETAQVAETPAPTPEPTPEPTPPPTTVEENGLHFTVYDDHAVLSAAAASLTSVTVPSAADGRPVTSIGENAFYGCLNLTRITLPEGLTSISARAFETCYKLANITLPESLTSIDAQAFSGCSALNSITLPEGLTSIGWDAFSGCTGLTSIHAQPGSYAAEFFKDDPRLVIDPAVPYTVEENGLTFAIQADHAVLTAADKSLTSVAVPAMAGGRPVTVIGSAFYGCDRLTDITLPEGVTGIGSHAFSECRRLTGITLPESLTSIGDSAFSGCDHLTGISLPESVTSIGDSAFSGCTALIGINLPEGVTSIGNGAFWRCTGLTGITLPEGVTSIGDETFYGCDHLTDIALPESLTSIGFNAFHDCSSLTGVMLPESLTSIGVGAFSGCSRLREIVLPESLARVESQAFQDCGALTAIHAPAGSYAAEFFKDDPRLVIDG